MNMKSNQTTSVQFSLRDILVKFSWQCRSKTPRSTQDRDELFDLIPTLLQQLLYSGFSVVLDIVIVSTDVNNDGIRKDTWMKRMDSTE